MLFSYNWLQKYFKERLPTPEKVSEGIIFHSFEVEGLEKYKDDTIFSIKILPDRAHDCLSHYGLAKEIAIIFDLEIKPELKLIGKSDLIDDNIPESDLIIKKENDKCLHYIGRIVRDVEVKESPDWLRESMESIGQKSINNIVDATNYVMFDIGNPIHAFDLDKLESSKIVIRTAKKGEKLTTLDKKDVSLDESVLIIADEKDPLAIAGIKGGAKAEVELNNNYKTKNIVIEVANFDFVTIHKTARKLGIFTDSAKRFENDVPPDLAEKAMERITDLIIKIAGGQKEKMVSSEFRLPKEKEVSFTKTYLDSILGISIEKNDIENILNKFEFKFINKEDKYIVTIPLSRLDLTMSCNLVEEIGRIYGYEKIKPKAPNVEFPKEENQLWEYINKARSLFINRGYKEVMNYTFTNKGEVEILASASNKNFLRTNLTDGLNRSLKLNKINAPLLGLSDIKIFEIGTIFHKNKEEMHIVYNKKKEIIEMKIEDFIKKTPKEFLENNLDEKDYQDRDDQEKFKLWSPYPFITRDIAVWVPEKTKSEELSKIYEDLGTELLITKPKLFDQFTKDDKTSYAFRLVFQSFEKTLTDREINTIMDSIEEKIKSMDWIVR